MKTLVEISLWLVPAALVYVAYFLFRRLGTNRRSLERVFTEPVDLAERPTAIPCWRDCSVVGSTWRAIAGSAAPAAFTAAMLLAIGVGLATAFAARAPA